MARVSCGRRARRLWGSCVVVLSLASSALAAPPKKPGVAQKDEKSAAAKKDDKKDDKGAAAKKDEKKDEKKDDKLVAAKKDDDKAVVGPRDGAGERRIEAPPAPVKDAKPAAEPEAPKASAEAARKEPERKAHQTGRAPKKPATSLPKGAPRPTPNDSARRVVAGGATTEDLARGTRDPELSALRDADRVLFPKRLEGLRSGFDWDLPETKQDGPDVVASGLPPEARLRAVPPATTDAAASDATWLKSLTMPNLPVRLEARVVKYLKFYRDSAKGRAIARVWAKKSGRFVPALKAELAKAGLPTDLVWLSLIESGHNPTIVSPAGAAGLWQFMPESGRIYGLTVDRWVDERMDPLRSTEAAIRYLSDLNRRFGNWELAMAAYNMGYGGLGAAIRKFNTNDYWELCRYEAGIPWETTLYVPKIFAIAIVMNNKKAFGIANVTPDPAESFDTVLVEPATSLEQVALAAEVGTRTIEALNPHYLASRAPPARPGSKPARFRVRVPAGKATSTRARMSQVWASDSKIESYVVKLGDTLDAIATAHGTNAATLRLINKMKDGETLDSGTILLVPRTSSAAAASPQKSDGEPEIVVVPPRTFAYDNRRRVFYRVRPGDTLGEIAQAFHVSRVELESWNALDPSARLQPGMALQVYVDAKADLARVRYIPESDARVLVSGTPEFIDYHEGLKGKKRLLVVVKPGDTVKSIGRRYGMSVGWMERVNRFARTKKLEPGETVVVYAPRNTPDAVARGDHLQPLQSVSAPHPDALPLDPDDEPVPSASRD